MQEKTPLVIIGYGSQAKAWALNLRDSKREVIIALRANSNSTLDVAKLGFKTIDLASSELKKFSNYVMLTPDHTHIDILKENYEFMPDGATVTYAHGFSFLQGKLNESFPRLNHLMLAPKAIASEVRFQYETGGKLAAAYSTEASRDKNQHTNYIMELAKDLGITAGPYCSNFEEETYADLFSEQSILCSLLPYAAMHSFNKLREKGIQQEIAYLECWYEVKLIADAMVKMGPQKFFKLISPNALLGGEKAQQLFFDKGYQEKLNSLLDDIWNRKFFQECEETDMDKLREDILARWDKEEICKVHERLSAQLL